jgi:primosomal replication protein N
MAGSVNKVILVGVIGKYGVTRKYAPSGTACAAFTLMLTEETAEHKYYSTLVPCELWGRKAEHLSTELQPGQLCLFEGKVSRKKQGEQWVFSIAGFDVTLLQPAVLVAIDDLICCRTARTCSLCGRQAVRETICPTALDGRLVGIACGLCAVCFNANDPRSLVALLRARYGVAGET